jgi:hypothetical protein
VVKAVEKTVDKDIHSRVTGCGRAVDSNPASFHSLHVYDIKGFFGVLQKYRALHNHSNNLSLRI